MLRARRGAGKRVPGSALVSTLDAPVLLSSGDKDLYIRQDKSLSQFAADVKKSEAKLMAPTQRPITEAALIPAQALAFMADRAHSRRTVAVKGASHVVMVSTPKVVARLIGSAAAPE